MDDDSTIKEVYKDEQTQKELNTPLADPTGLDAEDKEFLDLVLRLIDEGNIDLYKPETLFNKAVYDSLEGKLQGHADLEAVNMLGAIRDIKDLHDNNFGDSFQIQNLVKRARMTKERIETEKGDLFII